MATTEEDLELRHSCGRQRQSSIIINSMKKVRKSISYDVNTSCVESVIKSESQTKKPFHHSHRFRNLKMRRLTKSTILLLQLMLILILEMTTQLIVPSLIQVAGHTLASSSAARERSGSQNMIVFPQATQNGAADSSNEASNQAADRNGFATATKIQRHNGPRSPSLALTYYNPQPSVLSSKYNQADTAGKPNRSPQSKHDDQSQLKDPSAPSNGQNAFYQPPIGSRPQVTQQQAQQQQQQSQVRAPLGSTPSSIGKNERSQVAEWPFFKSFQVARNNQMMAGAGGNQQQQQQQPIYLQASPSSTMQPTTIVALDDRKQQAGGAGGISTTPEPPSPPRGEKAPGALGTAGNANSNQQELPRVTTQEASTTTTTMMPSTARTTSTTTTTTTTEAPSTSASLPMSGSEPEAQDDEKMLSMNELKKSTVEATTPAPETTTVAITSSTTNSPVQEDTTTAAAAAATTTTTTQKPPAEMLKEQMMIPARVHSSIQSAVNRLVEMGSRAAAAKQNEAQKTQAAPEEQQLVPQAAPQPQIVRLNGNSNKSLRSSLSLNVLLKNFGAFNLTSLDQILLKSSLNNQQQNKTAGNQQAQQPLERDHQKIEIRGLHHQLEHTGAKPDTVNSTGSSGAQLESFAPSQEQQAECKVEYTMKHVNISLANDDKSDYTCDYIIDRKLATAQSVDDEQALASLASGSKDRKICRLNLKSDFFSNETSSAADLGEGSGPPASERQICLGSTYLSIGKLKFCYLGSAVDATSVPSLNRAFSFPIEREAFDIRLVHKSSAESNNNNNNNNNGEIHIEIKPIFDSQESCQVLSEQVNDGQGVSRRQQDQRASLSSTRRPMTSAIEHYEGARPESFMSSSTKKPFRAGQQPAGVGARALGNHQSSRTGGSITQEAPANQDAAGVVLLQNGSPATNKRKSAILKMQAHPESAHLHPINHHPRLKQAASPATGQAQASATAQANSTSQSFDIDRNSLEARLDNGANRTRSSLTTANSGLAPPVELLSTIDNNKLPPLCGDDSGGAGSVHVSTVGQITTPNYPSNYTANTRCRHVIRRVSLAHCKLLLHFRDFDLTPSPLGDTSKQLGAAECPGDYLQIGETRYCNKYAMTGYKMYLNFSEAALPEYASDELPFGLDVPSPESIALLFNSDASLSGRGFLIKYQQLACESNNLRSVPVKPAHSRTSGSENELADKQQQGPKLHTLAPPVQQPDFSLALKTNTPPRGGSSGGGGSADSSQTSSSTRAPGAGRTAAGGASQQAKLVYKDDATMLSVERRPQHKSKEHQLQMMASTAASSAADNLLLAESPTTTSTTTSTTLMRRELPSLNQQQQQDRQSSVQCNQVNHEMSFLLSSHNFPSAYSNNLACLYYVRRNSSKVCYLELTFLKFDLEPDSDCRYDFLEVNNVRLCGSLKQETTRIYLFEEAIKLIKFKSDGVGVRGGFLIKAEQLECAPNGSILRSTISTISTSNNNNNLGLLSDPPLPVVGGGDGALQSPEQPLVSHSGTSRAGNSSSVFEYDGTPALSLSAHRTQAAEKSGSNFGARERNNSTGGGASAHKTQRNLFSGSLTTSGDGTLTSAAQQPASCDDVLYGSEITIRSPQWPESYARDDSLMGCKYTILRNTYARAATCQLELRFVHLRLGPSDCLDIDGMELLCGFNARNLVKYYPFGAERQTHITITFTTGAGTAKLFSARSATPPYSHQLTQVSVQPSPQNHSDLLPSSRAPLRFMILARQLECIDDFLAPQVDLDRPGPALTLGGGGGGGGVGSQISASSSLVPKTNETNLLYASHQSSGELTSARPAYRPRYVNRTTSSFNSYNPGELRPLGSSASTSAPAPGASKQGQQVLQRRVSAFNESQLSYDTSSSGDTTLSSGARNNSSSTRSSSSSSSSSGVLMYSFADSLAPAPSGDLRPISGASGSALAAPVPSAAQGTSSATCLIQFNQYNGILASSNVLRGQLDSAALGTLPSASECEIRLKLLPGFCKIQLTFGEFDLYPARSAPGGSLSQLCPGEYLELGGVQYCGRELRNSTRLLSTSLPSQRHISLRARQTSHNSFRAIFKQLECDPVPLEAVPATTSQGGQGQSSSLKTQSDYNNSVASTTNVSSSRGGAGGNLQQQQQQQHSTSGTIDFREISIKPEFFELNSEAISKNSAGQYEPNMFVIYKIKRATPSVCKLRLMFYKFELEPPSPFGCKRDFLDINNQDRLCGSMDFRLEDSSREYDWPSSGKDFQVSFVSDAYDQRAGFHIFGQQVSDPASCTPPAGGASVPNSSGSSSGKDDKADLNAPSGDKIGKHQQQQQQQHQIGPDFDDTTQSPPPAAPRKQVGSHQTRPGDHSKPIVTQQQQGPPDAGDNRQVEAASARGTSEQQAAAAAAVAKVQLPANCSSIINGERHFELASPNWPQRYDGLGACHYLVRRAGPEVCSLTLTVNSLILNINPQDSSATAAAGGGQVEDREGLCEADLGREDYLELDHQIKLCGLITRPRSFKFDFTTNQQQQRQFIVLKFVSNVAHGFGFHLEAQQNTCESFPSKSSSGDHHINNNNSNNNSRTTEGDSSSGGSVSPAPPLPATTSKTRKQNIANAQNQSFDTDVISYDDSPAPTRSSVDGSSRIGGGGGENFTSQIGSSGEDSSGARPGEQVATDRADPQQDEGVPKSSPAQCNRLLTGQHNLIESDNFPGFYGNNLDCLFAIRRLNQSVCAIDLTFNYFDLEIASETSIGSILTSSSDTCENDYLEIDYSRFCGSYPSGHKVRFNYFGAELDKIVRFRSDSSKSARGFSITVSQVGGGGDSDENECERTGNSQQQQQQHSETGSGMQAPANNGPATTTIGANEREVISYLPDSTGNGGSSTSSNAEQVMTTHKQMTAPSSVNSTTSSSGQHKNQRQSSSSPSSQVQSISLNQLPSSTLCQFSYHSTRQLLVSPNYNTLKSHYDNNLDCQYKIVAASYEICALRLTFLDLDLEQSRDCLNDYLLIDSKRYCGQLDTPLVGADDTKQTTNRQLPMIELDFDANLPREIDILFHTDAHVKSGRGFKLLYEQVPCQSLQDYSSANIPQPSDDAQQMPPAEQEFKLQPSGRGRQLADAQAVAAARQVRRLRFGQLSYPKNYVSSQQEQQPQSQAPQTLQQQQQQQGQSAVAASRRAWHENRPKMTLDAASQRDGEQRRVERTSSARAAWPKAAHSGEVGNADADDNSQYRTISSSSSSASASASSSTETGGGASNDLKLSKEIVVTRTGSSGAQVN